MHCARQLDLQAGRGLLRRLDGRSMLDVGSRDADCGVRITYCNRRDRRCAYKRSGATSTGRPKSVDQTRSVMKDLETRECAASRKRSRSVVTSDKLILQARRPRGKRQSPAASRASVDHVRRELQSHASGRASSVTALGSTARRSGRLAAKSRDGRGSADGRHRRSRRRTDHGQLRLPGRSSRACLRDAGSWSATSG